jgi:hypothetical protein
VLDLSAFCNKLGLTNFKKEGKVASVPGDGVTSFIKTELSLDLFEAISEGRLW